MGHFRDLPEYLHRLIQKVDLWLGMGAGFVVAVIALFLSMGQTTIGLITVVIATMSLFLSGYSVYREERVMRAARESAARLGHVGATLYPKDDEWNFHFRLEFEIWVDQDAWTDGLSMEVTALRPWRSWRALGTLRRSKRLKADMEQPAFFGSVSVTDKEYTYRRQIRTDEKPFSDTVEFGVDLDWPKGFNTIRFDLLIKLGSPVMVLRSEGVWSIDWDDYRRFRDRFDWVERKAKHKALFGG